MRQTLVTRITRADRERERIRAMLARQSRLARKAAQTKTANSASCIPSVQ